MKAFCAYCGRSIHDKEFVRHEVEFDGRPKIYWHLECATEDVHYQRHIERLTGELTDHTDPQRVLLAEILQRGKRRVKASSKFWESEFIRAWTAIKPQEPRYEAMRDEIDKLLEVDRQIDILKECKTVVLTFIADGNNKLELKLPITKEVANYVCTQLMEELRLDRESHKQALMDLWTNDSSQ